MNTRIAFPELDYIPALAKDVAEQSARRVKAASDWLQATGILPQPGQMEAVADAVLSSFAPIREAVEAGVKALAFDQRMAGHAEAWQNN